MFLYFRAHPEIWFTPDHVAHQCAIGRKRARRIILVLEELQKLTSIEYMAAHKWGRPRKLYKATRLTEDALDQLEIFQEGLAPSDVYAAFEKRGNT